MLRGIGPQCRTEHMFFAEDLRIKAVREDLPCTVEEHEAALWVRRSNRVTGVYLSWVADHRLPEFHLCTSSCPPQDEDIKGWLPIWAWPSVT